MTCVYGNIYVIQQYVACYVKVKEGRYKAASFINLRGEFKKYFSVAQLLYIVNMPFVRGSVYLMKYYQQLVLQNRAYPHRYNVQPARNQAGEKADQRRISVVLNHTQRKSCTSRRNLATSLLCKRRGVFIIVVHSHIQYVYTTDGLSFGRLVNIKCEVYPFSFKYPREPNYC